MAASGGRIVPAPGGVLIREASGDHHRRGRDQRRHVGQDEACCVAGIEAVGLKPDTGETPG